MNAYEDGVTPDDRGDDDVLGDLCDATPDTFLAGDDPVTSSPEVAAQLASLVAAASAPGTPDELGGLQAALTAFNAQALARSTGGRAKRRVFVGLGAAAALLLGGVGAAYANVLPTPIQEFAHDTIGAPEPTADPSTGPDGSPAGGSSSGVDSNGVAGVGGSATPRPGATTGTGGTVPPGASATAGPGEATPAQGAADAVAGDDGAANGGGTDTAPGQQKEKAAAPGSSGSKGKSSTAPGHSDSTDNSSSSSSGNSGSKGKSTSAPGHSDATDNNSSSSSSSGNSGSKGKATSAPSTGKPTAPPGKNK